MTDDLDSLKPTRKAAPSNSVAIGAGIGGPLAVLVVSAIASFGVTLAPEVTAALGTLITSLVAYFPRGGRRD